jgi:hypothetical protein
MNDVQPDLFNKITQMMYPPAGSGNYMTVFTNAIEKVQRYYLENNDWDTWTDDMKELAEACWLILGIE